MLIPIIQDYYQKGKLPFPKHRALIPFFPNCNLSIRKSVFDSVGPYDEQLKAAEDSDLCRRTALGGFHLYFEPGARVYHACRPDLPSLVRQWYSYGYWSAAVYKKHMENNCEVYSSTDPVPKINSFSRILALKQFPFPVLFFLTYFSWILLLSMASVTAFAAGFNWTALVLALGLLFYLVFLSIKHPVFKRIGLKDRVSFLPVSALINISCIAGSLAGGLRNRMLYIFSGI